MARRLLKYPMIADYELAKQTIEQLKTMLQLLEAKIDS
jgi:hypothetical protein